MLAFVVVVCYVLFLDASVRKEAEMIDRIHRKEVLNCIFSMILTIRLGIS